MTKALIETTKGNFEVEFFDADAPNTVKNFVSLAQKGYYNGLKFHRVIDDFVIQGGDPTGTGAGGPGYSIACETSGGNQKHIDGALSMAHAGKDTGGSQFFVVLNKNSCGHLDRKHTVFGKTVKGLEVVKKIQQGDKMNKITVSEVSDLIQNKELKTLPSRK
jgi:peptidyl-prolyl cis-trans isomerase B (cyclophilin B)